MQGTGHVMRCLTLAEELIRRGNKVFLMTNRSGIEWLEEIIELSHVEVIEVTHNELPYAKCLALSPDFVVIDSYQISADEISNLADHLRVLAIVDGDTRGIIATEYLDHNLGAELTEWPEEVSGRIMAGSSFALIRDAVLQEKRENPWIISGRLPHIVAVMGGSDPTGTIVRVASALLNLRGNCTATLVVSEKWDAQVKQLLEGNDGFEIIQPTAELHAVLASADIAISASGTSSWELCTLGIPSILIAVVENQSHSLQRMIDHNLVLGIDLIRGGKVGFSNDVEKMVRDLIENAELRKKLSLECAKYFDGSGKIRVVNVLEEIYKK